MTFEELKVNPDIIKALHEIGIKTPTTIQEKAIPIISSGKDLIGMSKTGSGKTAAFGIPVIEQLTNDKTVQVLILSPTRELAVQISEEMHKFGKYMGHSIAVVFGGVAIGPQMDRIKQSRIVVGTPGRILDHLNRKTLDLSKLKTIVLDEADKMVDMGFIIDIKKIINYAPKSRQILLFGATISNEINMLKKNYMKDPQTVKAEAQVREELLEQYYYNVMPRDKFSLLVHLLKEEKTDRVIIFCSTRATVEIVSKNLRTNGVKNDMIHGKLTQNKRLNVIEKFNKGKIDILVASSVAARGLHIDMVTHVFNYDLSQDPQEYIHRVGRTARAGQSGKAITLLSQKDYDVFNDILQRYKPNIKALEIPTFEKLKFDVGRRDSRSHSRGGYGQRSSHGGRRSTGSYHGRGRSGGGYGRSRSTGGQSRS